MIYDLWMWRNPTAQGEENMLNSEVCMSAIHSGNNSYNKRLKALEKAIADMSTIVASKTVSADTLKGINAEITNTATINKENVEQSTIQDLNVSHIDNRGGFAALGSVTAESLTVGTDVKADYTNLHAEQFKAELADIDEANIDKVNINTLKVKNKIDELNIAKLYIDSVLALTQDKLTLKIAEAFHNADFQCALRPTWQSKPIALKEDSSTIFTLLGIVDSDTELPVDASNGDTYFVRQHVDGALTVPSIAAFIDGAYEFVNYPGLDDYVDNNTFNEYKEEIKAALNVLTNFDSTLVPTEDRVTFEGHPEYFRILSLYNSIQDILHQLNDTDDNTWMDWRNSVDTFISTTFPEKLLEIQNELAKRPTEPEEVGQYLREKLADDTFQWTKLKDNDAFVNKSYTDDVHSSRITNDENGVKVESDLPITASTAESKADETTKAIINQEYLRTNLALSKEASSVGKSNLYYEEKGIMPQSEHLYLTGMFNNGSTMFTRYNKYNPNLYKVGTKNYQYYRLTNSAANEANTYNFFFSLDNKGNLIKMSQVQDSVLNTEAKASVHGGWAVFNPDAYDGIVDDVAYFPFPRALANSTDMSYINMYDKGKFVGRVKDSDDNEFGIWGASSNADPQYYHWNGKSLRGDAKRVLLVNSSSVDADAIKALLIGIDAKGEEALDRCKPIALPARITRGMEGLAAGKNYWWFQNSTSNIFSRVDKDGNIASYPLVDPIDSIALSATGCRNAWNNYIELENGDVMFYISDTAAGRYDYFIYCSDNPTEVSPVTVYRSAVKFSDADIDDRWPSAANFPFVELGNYVYFFQSFGGSTADANITMPVANTAYWKSVAGQYARFDKTAKVLAYQALPWTIGDYAVYGPAQKLLTKDNYLWVFPNQHYDATTVGSRCLVISPTGQATTVDLGTGSSINWFYVGGPGGFMQGRSCYLSDNAESYWNFARMPICLAAVNSHGLGCLISEDFKHLMLFKGNGEFKLYDYSDGTRGFLPQGMITTNNGPSLVPMKDGFLIGFRHDTSYRLSNPSEPEEYGFGFIYVSTNGDDINKEPTYKMFDTLEGNGIFHKYQEEYENNITFEDFKKRFRTMHDCWLHVPYIDQGVGLAVWSEKASAANGTIYLKDGDYTISEVEE